MEYLMYDIFGLIFRSFFSSILFIGGIIWALIWCKKLSKRLDNQAKHMLYLESLHKGGKPVITQKEEEIENKATNFAKHAKQESTLIQTEQTYQEPEKTESFAWEEFFTKKFFSILGVTSLLLALAFFLSWAFSSGIIGEKGRIAIGVIISTAFLVGGELLRTKYKSFFAFLSSIGIAGLLITTYFAQHAYGFVTPIQSFLLYAIEVGAGLFLTLRYESRVLGNFVTLGGLVAPFLIESLPNEYLLLFYLIILSASGFVISIRHKWIELIMLLFVGVSIAEFTILNNSGRCEIRGGCENWVEGNAIGFLALVYVLHALLGSGGVIRMIRENLKQTLASRQEDRKSGLEMVLFVGSVLVANLIAWKVFSGLGWDHFGFFVLAQGFGFYFLSEYFKQKGLLLYRNIATGATMISIIMATIWEMDAKNPIVISLALMLEGSLFLYAGNVLKERWFAFFGRIAAILGSLYLLDSFTDKNPNGIFTFLGLIVFWATTVFACKAFEKRWEKVLGVIAGFWGIVLVFTWQDEILLRLLKEWDIRWLFFLVPALFAGILGHSRLISSHALSKILALIFSILAAFTLWDFANFWSDKEKLSAFVALIIVIASLFGTLLSFFYEEKDSNVTIKLKLVATYIVLSVATLTLLIWGGEILKEPIRTLLWVSWGGLLLGIGIQNDWKRFRFFGIGMMLLLIAKLYFIDVWEWEVYVRFVAFGLLGVSLLTLSFFYQKIMNKK